MAAAILTLHTLILLGDRARKALERPFRCALWLWTVGFICYCIWRLIPRTMSVAAASLTTSIDIWQLLCTIVLRYYRTTTPLFPKATYIIVVCSSVLGTLVLNRWSKSPSAPQLSLIWLERGFDPSVCFQLQWHP